MDDIVNQSFKKIAKGTGIIFIGTIVGLIFRVVNRILVIRYISLNEYGYLSLAMVIISIFILLSSLGLPDGVTRNLAYYRGKGDIKRVFGVIISAFHIAIITSIIFAFSAFFISGSIATFFKMEELEWIIKVLSFTIPFSVGINILVSVYRGLERPKEGLYFNVFSAVLKFSLLLFSIYFIFKFQYIIYVYLMVPIITFILFGVYAFKKLPRFLDTKKGFVLVRKELLYFSAPLFFVGVVGFFLNQTDTFMLGYFTTADVVALYNGAMTLARLIPLVLQTAAFMFLPVISNLYSKNLMKEINKIYVMAAKWIFIATLPIFLMFFVFPYTTLHFLYGERYLSATYILMILSFGFMIHVLLGLNGTTLLSMGETKFLMFSSFTGAILNVILNFFLIPYYSMYGAAIASVASYALINVINSVKLYKKSGVHPFSKSYIKVLGTSISLVILFFILNSYTFFYVDVFHMLLYLILFEILYILLLFLIKGLDKDDVKLLQVIGKKLGIESITKKFLKKLI